MKLYKSIADKLAKDGINLLVGDIYDFQELWLEWYKGHVESFHKYKMKVNGINKAFDRKTLNLAKKFCEDMSKLSWTEKTRIALDSDEKTKKLWEILDSKENSFTKNFADFIEKGFALGTGVLVEYQDENGKILIDYIDGTSIIPFKYTNSYITGLITINRFTEEKKYYTQITIHSFDGKEYIRENQLYVSEKKNDVGEKMDFTIKFPNVKEKETIVTQTPRFQVFKPNLVNNVDIQTPMGISIFANSIDVFQSADIKYDAFCDDFILGKKKILVDRTAMKAQQTVNENGEIEHVQYFDANDRAFVAISGMEEQPVKEIDFNLRSEEFISAINADINYASSNIGLGSNWYKFDSSGLKTATEVISENSEAFRTKKHNDIIVNDVIYDLVRTICEMAGIETKEIIIEPDDSIIEDKETERTRAQSEVMQGLRSKKNYLMTIRGMSEEEAEKELQLIKEEQGGNEEELIEEE